MSKSKADLMFHPIRLRIITAISSQRMTAKDLAEILPDIPQTTLYRHINALVEGGILQITDETPVRGTVERTYALAELPSLRPEDLRGMRKRDYEQAFTVYLSTLMSAAQKYLESKGEDSFDPLADGVELSLATLNLSDEEFRSVNQRILEILMPVANNQPGPGRKKRVFTYLFIPQ